MAVPDICLRTTLMTGFPGEGDEEFAELIEFVKIIRFERMGAFAYCEEDDTWAAKHLSDNIPAEIKEKRRRQILELQEEISLSLNQNLIGKSVEVLIDRIEEGELIARTQWDSPEVDCEVHIPLNGADRGEICPGNYITVKITDTDAYDIFAEIID